MHSFSLLKETKALPENKTLLKRKDAKKINQKILLYHSPVKISDFLTAPDLAHYCSVNKELANPIIFFRALYGREHPITSKDFKYFQSALRVYQLTMHHAYNKKPAILYKIRFEGHKDAIKPIHTENHGRVYTPNEENSIQYHSWPVNLAWLYAQIQVGRDFFVHSPLVREYIFRQKYPGEYSAYVKEIAAILKVGYTPMIYAHENNYHFLVRLIAPHNKQKIRLLKICDLDPSETDIQSAIAVIQPFQKQQYSLWQTKYILFLSLYHYNFYAAIQIKNTPERDQLNPTASTREQQIKLLQKTKKSEDCLNVLLQHPEHRKNLCDYHGFPEVMDRIINLIKSSHFNGELENSLISTSKARYQQIMSVVLKPSYLMKQPSTSFFNEQKTQIIHHKPRQGIKLSKRK